jgi:hypothetical protein
MLPQIAPQRPLDEQPPDAPGRTTPAPIVSGEAAPAVRSGIWRERARFVGLNHGLPLLVYALLAIGLTWPTLQHFTTSLTSDDGDARSYLWQLWFVRQALLAGASVYDAPLLYFPHGATLLVHGAGPLMGVLALPFWFGGPEAAYNAVILLSTCLSGYGMYLLARTLGFDRLLALFAGVVVVAAPFRLAGTVGHLDRLFIALLPLALLCFYRALDPERSLWWTGATAVVLLLTLLHNAYQFVFAALGMSYFFVVACLECGRARLWSLVQGGLLIAGGALILTGPLLFAIMQQAYGSTLMARINDQSFLYQPDLLQFFTPSTESVLFSLVGTRFRPYDVYWGIETSVYLTWTVIALCGLAVWRGGRAARVWTALAVGCVVLALGPSLKVYGETRFTDYHLPLLLPYALLTSLPGMEVMRTPARFMLIAEVALAIGATFGLAVLIRRLPRQRYTIVGLATLLMLVEVWPRPWPAESLRPVPEFYKQIAADPAVYGVFDLPINSYEYTTYLHESSYAQMDQMTHHKGIASGYISRPFAVHPVFPCLISLTGHFGDVTVNGQPCSAQAQTILARDGYRYVVFHKPQDGYVHYRPGSWPEASSRAFIRSAFGDQAPIQSDALVDVYAVDQALAGSEAPTTLSVEDGWRDAEADWHWATSPATLLVESPREQAATLEITPALIFDPSALNGLGERGVLTVASNGGSINVEIARDQQAAIPITLQPGVQRITLTLRAGNFRPVDFGGTDTSALSFAVRTINLRT